MLRRALVDLGWLLGRGYAEQAALALVGDRFQLPGRARTALRRCAASPESVRRRADRRVEPAGRAVLVDGFNVLVTVEAALAGGVILVGADGRPRDLASVHGTYRRVAETERALELLLGELAAAAEADWLFDRPVSNSGRLSAMVRARGGRAELLDRVDAALRGAPGPVATADGPVLDAAAASVDLVGPILARLPDAWIVDLRGG